MFCCSKTYDRVEAQGITTWSYYRYRLLVEYKYKPTLAPPLIVIGIVWQLIISLREIYSEEDMTSFCR